MGDTLESLSLKNSSQLKDTDLQELSALKNLKRLDLSGCYGVSDDVLMAIAKACGSTLEEIDVSHTPDSGFTQEPLECRVTEVGLQILATECKKLRKVALRCCDSVTDSGIEQLVAGCRYLTSIDLAKCKSLTDAGVSALAKGCPHLEWLSLDAASKDELPDDEEGATEHKYGITDHSILEIEKYNGRTLTHLDVSWCRCASMLSAICLLDRAAVLYQ